MMSCQRRMDERLQTISERVETLEGTRRCATRWQAASGERSPRERKSSDESRSPWEWREGSWWLRVGRARLNSRQRKKLLSRVKQTLDENEGTPGEVLRSDAERPMMRFDRFETGLRLSTERWSRGNATASEGEEFGSGGGDTRTGRGQEVEAARARNARERESLVGGFRGIQNIPSLPGIPADGMSRPGPSRRDRDDTLDCSRCMK